METARLLARFKLQVRRSLDMAVDLAALTADEQYAEKLLHEVEERAEDEELLLMVVRLRDRLRAQYQPAPVVEPANEEVVKPATPAVRDYRFGARG
ncbi:hypothetical protein E6O51_04325 [Pseudothauera rhizosphaerae]|uniref:Uncharacterized protein n=1 Tax=Pseudothauera rhizosphaerae TaxID=2565932 RepID=A0A4S4AWC0_9RHOO|nr:hypothetical protein E6O51_04325 [Pseudothauera rhizosphaerae]